MTFYKRSMVLAAAAGSALIATGPVVGQVGGVPPVGSAPSGSSHRPVAELDVAGVRLRASPAEARSAVARAGYRVTYVGEAATFAQEVASEAARRRGVRPPDARNAGTARLSAIGPHQEDLIVDFMQGPTGSEVSDVNLAIPKEAMSADPLRRQLLGKYGSPDSSRANASELGWCSPETLANCGRTIATSGPLDDQYPLLTATIDAYGGGGRLRLRIGETAFPRLAAEKEAAVERLVPKTNRAAF